MRPKSTAATEANEFQRGEPKQSQHARFRHIRDETADDPVGAGTAYDLAKVVDAEDLRPFGRAGHVDDSEHAVLVDETVVDRAAVDIIAGEVAFIVDAGHHRAARRTREVDGQIRSADVDEAVQARAIHIGPDNGAGIVNPQRLSRFQRAGDVNPVVGGAVKPCTAAATLSR